MGKPQGVIRTRIAIVAALVALALTACASLIGGGTDQQVRDYEASIRSEADWLWNNMNYARTHLDPEPALCGPETFERQAVTLTAEAREGDTRTAALVDRLDYAAALVTQAHDEWTLFCTRRSSAVNTAAQLERRLLPAYDSMNQVRVALLPSEAAPQPGST
jgi:hypothetical protein